MVVRTFLHWMAAASAEQRAAAASALARAWLQSELDASEREDAEAALAVLLDDPAPQVRKALAEPLSESADAPRHVILGLANDRPDIASIVLRKSPVLMDFELVDLTATSEPAYQAAIAARRPMSRQLAAAIAEVAEAGACAVLAANDAAELGGNTMRRLAERFGDDAGVRQVLLERPDLPGTVKQILISRLGSALNSLVTGHDWMRRERADRVVRDACDKATVELAQGTVDGEMQGLVRHLRDSGQLTTALLLRMLCSGNIRFFEAALTVLADVKAARVRALIAEGRASGLRALYQKAGLPPAALPTFAVALDVFREMDFDGERGDIAGFTRRMIEQVLKRSAEFAPEEHDQLMLLLRRIGSDAARDAAREFVATTIAA